MSEDEEEKGEGRRYLLGFDGKGFYEQGPPNLATTTLLVNILLVTIRRHCQISMGPDASKEEVMQIMVRTIAAGLGDFLKDGIIITPPAIASLVHDVIDEFQKGKK